MDNRWHIKKVKDIFTELRSSEHGLSGSEAERRLKEDGLNKLPEAKADSLAIIFLRQFQSSLIYILLGASGIIFALGEIIDGSIILVVLIFNAVVGTLQEGKAQNTLLALKKFVETDATVLRDGHELIIADQNVVGGDIIVLREGEKVPADARLILATNLKIDEAAFTGESVPVHKIAEVIKKPDLPSAEQGNMVFKGTHVVAGNGRAVVVATGPETVIGRISKQIKAIDTEMPLRKDIRRLSYLIITAVAVISVILFSLGVFQGKTVKQMFTTIVSLSVSIIPEGLPIVLTLILATGVWRMSKRQALVRKLQAVEALGQARVIAVDKTGTVTKNEIVVQKVYIDGKFFEVGGIGYEPKGEIKLNGVPIVSFNYPELLHAGRVAAFCSNAELLFSEERKEWRIIGDPTEAAMLVFARKIGFDHSDLERESPEISEIPFDYKNKYHATLHQVASKKLLIVTGAPENVLTICERIWEKGKNSKLASKERAGLESIFLKMSREGMRVVAFATSWTVINQLTPKNVSGLTFGGFLGMKDAIRPEVYEAVRSVRSAGMRIIMITGDHRATAEVIAKETGIFKDGDGVLTGHDIDQLIDKELAERVGNVSVFARVTPQHKLKIIRAFKDRGEIIAMTGDGVNDAPSLVAADLGLAMGKIGTEVAKEAADIILLDDNFGNIVAAVEEGRSIVKTIKKVILYLFSTSWGEVFAIAGSLMLGFPLPLLPAQIIWLNFVTDGFLDVALAMEPKEERLLTGKFERPKKFLIDKLMVQRMFLMALPMALGTLFLFRDYFETDLTKAWTVSLTTLAVFQWFNAWNCRHESKSIFKLNPFSNKFLVAATITVILFQIFAVYNPVMQKLLRTAPLTLNEWFVIIAVASSIVIVEEIRKLIHRRLGFSGSG